jgi:hypothetical protein
MTAISFPDYKAPAGWTNLTALPAYSALVGQGVQVICRTGFGSLWWGGAATPAPGHGILMNEKDQDFETAVAEIWLYGPATYAIVNRL